MIVRSRGVPAKFGCLSDCFSAAKRDFRGSDLTCHQAFVFFGRRADSPGWRDGLIIHVNLPLKGHVAAHFKPPGR